MAFKEVDEICEVDLDCVNLIARETPSELDERIVERLRRKIEFSEVYLEVWYLDDKDEGEGEENAGAFSVRVKDSRNVLEKTPTDIIELVLGELTNKNGLQVHFSLFF